MSLKQLKAYRNYLSGNNKIPHVIIYGSDPISFVHDLVQIWYESGLISNPDIKILNRRDFIGEYVGQTSLKTNNVLEAHKDKVILIDEGYTLMLDQDDRFGHEAIFVLIEHLDKRSRPVILSGEREHLEKWLDQHPYINRRFDYRFMTTESSKPQ
jgi:hypothetical protein